MACTELWPNVDLESSAPECVRDATLAALAAMHLDTSAGFDGHNVNCTLKSDRLVEHRDEIIGSLRRRLKRSTIIRSPNYPFFV